MVSPAECTGHLTRTVQLSAEDMVCREVPLLGVQMFSWIILWILQMSSKHWNCLFSQHTFTWKQAVNQLPSPSQSMWNPYCQVLGLWHFWICVFDLTTSKKSHKFSSSPNHPWIVDSGIPLSWFYFGIYVSWTLEITWDLWYLLWTHQLL